MFADALLAASPGVSSASSDSQTSASKAPISASNAGATAADGPASDTEAKAGSSADQATMLKMMLAKLHKLEAQAENGTKLSRYKKSAS